VTFATFDAPFGVSRWLPQSVDEADNMNEPRRAKQAKSYISSHFLW
jgi:hypothetical protein